MQEFLGPHVKLPTWFGEFKRVKGNVSSIVFGSEGKCGGGGGGGGGFGMGMGMDYANVTLGNAGNADCLF